ncbi:uncharacterized protein LOC124361045 [Homalodisca vitripennis]|uniref:uncharacterized protein LOC124361045 n=1 Tax=Homalodisca vitripennis TaxID=197043 RepID=UPI001EEB568F|nr:uncharacterized protein LOC124361045 [Homalodisca vitripennis]
MFLTATVLAVVGLCLPAWAVNPLQGVESAEGSHRRLCPPMDNVPQPPERVNTTHLLQRLRAEMRRNNVVHGPPIDAYIVTTDDAHQSEFVAEHDERLKYISGFSGSYGVAVITETKAALWTDGRYLLQADNELGCDWLLMGRGDVQLEEQYKHVLDHSIESDTRLMQYTNQVFVAATSLVESPVRASVADCAVQCDPPLCASVADCAMQCDLPTDCGDQRCADTRDLVAGLKTTIEVLEAS